MHNSFRERTYEENALKEKKEKARQALRKETQELAMKCLNHKDFVKYREKYEKMRAMTIDMLIEYEEPDPLKYAFGVKIALTKLHQLKLLLDNVIVDNRKRVI